MKVIREKEEFDALINQEKLVDFLYKHLDRFGDSKNAISICIDDTLSKEPNKGGFIVTELENDEIVGAVVMLATGMKKYIPEYYLVYVAVRSDQRGKGIGAKIIKKSIELADGDVALHVEYDNPAKRLYERIGFSSKYAEMRYNKE